MSSLWPHAHSDLKKSLAQFSKSLDKLKAANPVDIAEITQQLEAAAESVRNLRSLVTSALPDACWRTREEYDAVVARVGQVLEARARLLTLAKELAHGRIVHRRAVRVDQVDSLREQAIVQLQALAEIRAEPPYLPGPEAGQWIEWALGLKEPEDAEALKALRNGFIQLDAFVANLEPDMWVIETKTLV